MRACITARRAIDTMCLHSLSSDWHAFLLARSERSQEAIAPNKALISSRMVFLHLNIFSLQSASRSTNLLRLSDPDDGDVFENSGTCLAVKF